MKPDSALPDAASLSALLSRYVAEWARLAARRPPSPTTSGESDGDEEEDTAPPAERRLVYVDAFARSGLAGAGALPSTGRAAGGERAVEAVRALFAAAGREGGRRTPVAALAVLVEEDPAQVAALRDALEAAGLGERVRQGTSLGSLRPGEVALVESSFAAVTDEVLALLSAPETEALAWLAPPSPRALPWEWARAFAAAEGVEVLLVLPHADFHRQARYGNLPLADLPPHPRRMVEGCSAFLGDARHAWLASWRAAEREGGAGEAEARAAALYLERLRGGAGDRLARPLRLASGEEAAGVLHLFQVTSDPARALALNAAVRAAGLEDRVPLETGRAAPRVPEPVGEPAVLELFAPEEMGAARAGGGRAEREVDAAGVADSLAERFVGGRVSFRDVLRHLAETGISPDDVRRAMALLKRSGRAVFRSLADDDAEVAFPESPLPPSLGARRRRSPRADDAAPLLDLGDAE